MFCNCFILLIPFILSLVLEFLGKILKSVISYLVSFLNINNSSMVFAMKTAKEMFMALQNQPTNKNKHFYNANQHFNMHVEISLWFSYYVLLHICCVVSIFGFI